MYNSNSSEPIPWLQQQFLKQKHTHKQAFIAACSVVVFLIVFVLLLNIHLHGHKVWRKYQPPVAVATVNSPAVKQLMQRCASYLENNTHAEFFTAMDVCVSLQYACMRTNEGVWHFVNPTAYESSCKYTHNAELCSVQYNTLLHEQSYNRLCLHDNARRVVVMARQKFIKATAHHPITLEVESRQLSFEDAVHFQYLYELLHDGTFPCNEQHTNTSYCEV